MKKAQQFHGKILTAVLFASATLTNAAPPAPTAAAIRQLPLSFERNQGQADAHVKFLARGYGYSLFLTGSEAVMALTRPLDGASTVLRMKLLGALPNPEIHGLEPLAGVSNYLIGSDPQDWRSNIAHYSRVQYRRVYRGVDLTFYGNQRHLEYDFVVAPGADPGAIQLSFAGAEKMYIDRQGDLVLQLPAGEIRKRKPAVYQVVNGVRQEIAGRYVLHARHRVSFSVAKYDPSRPLVIDPLLSYATYLGGSDSDVGQGIALDSAGNAYVTGFTLSTNFPTTAGVYQTTNRGPSDVFVTKINPTGTAFLYSTYLGGAGSDTGKAIAIDSQGAVYIAGYTNSTDFPTTPGAPLKSLTSGQCSSGGSSIRCPSGFVAKLNAGGTALLYSTYLGGNGLDLALAIAVDASGSVYVTGYTYSTNFPTTPGVLQANYVGGANCGAGGAAGACDDAFVTKLSPSGTSFLYSTYLGGSHLDQANGIAIDAAGNAYVTGSTRSANFPVTPGAYQTALKPGACGQSPCDDAFITKLNPSGTALVYSTLLGGANSDFGQSIALDASNNAYILGATSSTDLPTTSGAFQRSFGGGASDVFVAAVNAAGNGLVASSYAGGAGTDTASSIVLDGAGNVYAVGDTTSSGFPGTPLALASAEPQQGVEPNGFQIQLNPGLTKIAFSSVGAGQSNAAISTNLFGRCITGLAVTGMLSTSPGAAQGTAGGSNDGKVVCESLLLIDEPPTAAATNNAVKSSDPVSFATGEVLNAELDFNLGGPLPLVFERYYASLLKGHGISGALGANWMHNFDISLAVSGSSVVVTLFGGKTVAFQQNGSVWQLVNPEKFNYQLASSGTGYKFLDLALNLVYTFSSSGALSRIEDRNGNALTVTPGPSGPSQVSDGLGRSLAFTYTSGNLTSLQDQTGRTVSFTYTSGNLTGFTDANGKTSSPPAPSPAC